jgi:serine/threonine protein kinase
VAQQTFVRSPGAEPLPGYVLIEPLGRGGFGEVWKCQAPGGLLKAVKIVSGGVESADRGNEQLRQEYEAFQRVKGIRHPFLLSLERVELVGNELVMVMELADRQLGDRFTECRRQGLPGIPRGELVGYLAEAAEALDVIGARYGLQHLDVKPANLFLTAGHVQVGDYGLVSKSTDGEKGTGRGLTPRYAAPEVLCGEVHTNSDQYSLALVYYELLTGAFPYPGKTAQELMLQHVTTPPDLRALPPFDRTAVGRALAKKPGERFGSCLELVQALMSVTPPSDTAAAGGASPRRSRRDSGEAPPAPGRTATIGRRRPAMGPPPDTHAAPPTPVGADTSLDAGFSVPIVKLDRIHSVVPVSWLLGKDAAKAELAPAEAVAAIVRAADAGRGPPGALGEVVQLGAGSWSCRFLTTIDPRMAELKLGLLWDERGVKPESPQPGLLAIRRDAPAPGGLFGFAKRSKQAESGYEVSIWLPEPGAATGQVSITAELFGSPSPDFARLAEREIATLMEGVRNQLNTISERRKHPRIPASFPLTLFALRGDGRVELPVKGTCQDVSAGGVALTVPGAIPTKYLFGAFEGVPKLDGLAILTQIVRTQPRASESLVCARFRLDVGSGA